MQRWLRFEHEGRVQYGLLEAQTVQSGRGDPLTQELVSRLSHDLTLEAGDVITCAASLGPLLMRPGTQVEIEIAEVGILSNRFVAGPPEAS